MSSPSSRTPGEGRGLKVPLIQPLIDARRGVNELPRVCLHTSHDRKLTPHLTDWFKIELNQPLTRSSTH